MFPYSSNVSKYPFRCALKFIFILALTADEASSRVLKLGRKNREIPNLRESPQTERFDSNILPQSEGNSSYVISSSENETIELCEGSACQSNITNLGQQKTYSKQRSRGSISGFGRTVGAEGYYETHANSREEQPPDLEVSSNDEEWLNLVFNLEGRQAWTTGYVNHLMVEGVCSLSNPCLASYLVLPLCGTDGKSYLNPGVFQCAQKCDKNLTVLQVGPCPHYKMPPEPPQTTTPHPSKPTRPGLGHKTTALRLKLRGILVQPILRLIGLHVHDDGGFYLADESKNREWWNV